MTIPARVHFIWLGTRLPWAYVYAIMSAAENSGAQEVILHHCDPLEDHADLRVLGIYPHVRLSRLDPIACLAKAGAALGVEAALVATYRKLENPSSCADMLRVAILFTEGGLYLDLDTVTTASLTPLLDTRQFVASEWVIWPQFVRGSRSPAVWCRALGLDLLRKTMRRASRGWEMFRWVEKWCFRAVTNAVMGAEADSTLCAAYLRAMAVVAPEQCTVSYALGPDLLQQLVCQLPEGGITIVDPEVFCPLPPQISEHWFRIARRVQLSAALRANTRAVHWYASVRTKAKVAGMDPDYVRGLRDRQLYSALVHRYVRMLPGLPRSVAA